jgi:hypothetical protein
MPPQPANTNNPYTLDMHLARVNNQLRLDILAADIIKKIVTALKILQIFCPNKIEYVETGNYNRCQLLDQPVKEQDKEENTKSCSCHTTNKDLHWDGNPTVVAVAMKLPVTTISELMYNYGRVQAFRWAVQIMTEEAYLKELQHFPDVIYDIFTYSVRTNYLTEETTKAAIKRWLKTYCPKLNYNFELVKRDLTEVSKVYADPK